MILRAVSLAIAGVFIYGLAQTQPWAHPAWTHEGWERFVLAMCVTAVLTLGAPKYLFYGVVLVLACSTGIQPVLGLAFVLLGALNLGGLLFRQKDDRLNLLAGFAIYVWIFSLTASLPINNVWFWGLMLATPIAIERRFTLPLPQPSLPVAMPLVANFLLALKPEVSADGLGMHLAIVQWVKDHGRFHFDVTNHIWAVNPMAGDWALALAGLFGNGEPAARLLNYVWLLVLVSFVYRTLRRRLNYRPAALLTGIFAATPMLQLTSTSMFVENFWAALLVGALLAIEQGEFVMAATLAGACGASKLLGLAPAPVLAAYAFLKPFQDWRNRATEPRAKEAGDAHVPTIAANAPKKRKWKLVLACAAIFTAIAIVPYARAYLLTGNPVFHYANAFFKSPYLRSDVNFTDNRFPPRLDGRALYDVTFRTNLFVESEPGTAGYQWLWFLPLASVALITRTQANGAASKGRGLPAPSFLELAALATAVFLILFVFSQQASLRYVEAAMPLLTIAFAPAAAAILEDPGLRSPGSLIAIALFALNLFQMPASGGYHRDFALIPFSTPERERYITRHAPARPLIDELNRIAPGAPVAILDGDDVARLRGPAWGSTWHTPRFAEKLMVTHSASDYISLMHEFHIEYLIAPREGHWHYIEDSAMNAFLTSCTDPLATSGVLQLVKLRPNATVAEWPPAPPGTYDDSNARIAYSGPWYLDQSFAETAHRTVSYSSNSNATVKFQFTGTKLSYYFTRAFNRGKASIEIDGVSKGIVDAYSKEPEWQAHVTFDAPGAGSHTIVIRYAGPPGAFIDLDQFVVEQ